VKNFRNQPKGSGSDLIRIRNPGWAALSWIGVGLLGLVFFGPWSVFVRMIARVADPVLFWPDPAPDPANQNFKIGCGSRILPALKESIQTSKFFSHQTYFFLYLNDDYFFLKNGKSHLKMCKTSIF